MQTSRARMWLLVAFTSLSCAGAGRIRAAETLLGALEAPPRHYVPSARPVFAPGKGADIDMIKQRARVCENHADVAGAVIELHGKFWFVVVSLVDHSVSPVHARAQVLA